MLKLIILYSLFSIVEGSGQNWTKQILYLAIPFLSSDPKSSVWFFA